MPLTHPVLNQSPVAQPAVAQREMAQPALRAPLSLRAAAAMRKRRALVVAGSVVLHALAIAALLVVRTPEPDHPVAPSYELLFDNGGASTPSTSEQTSMDATPQSSPEAATPDAAAPTAQADPAPLPPEPPQQVAMAPPDPVPAPPDPGPPPPAPDAAPSDPPPQAQAMPQLLRDPPPPVPETPPPDPAPAAQAAPAPVPADAPAAPVQMAMAPPDPSPAPPDVAVPPVPPQPQPQLQAPPPSLPAVRLAQPDTLPPPVSPQSLVPDFQLPAPPPPLPPLLPPRPRPAPPQPTRQALGTLGAPMDLNFGQASSRAPAPRAPGSRGIDFSLGAPKPGPNRSEAFFDARAANVGADWAQGLETFWRQHRYYPRQAAEAGEDGTVRVVLVVNRLGRVKSVEVKTRSGSPFLDMAAVAVWRNAQLAPLPAETAGATITIPLTINYILIR